MNEIGGRLDYSSHALVARIERELGRLPPKARPAETETVLVGGWAKVGRTLEDFLAACVAHGCEERQLDEQVEIRTLYPSASMDKATAGQLARLVTRVFVRPWRRPVSLILADLNTRPSRLWNLIDVRNRVVHDPAGLPGVAAARATLDPVRLLVQNFRKSAGWR